MLLLVHVDQTRAHLTGAEGGRGQAGVTVIPTGGYRLSLEFGVGCGACARSDAFVSGDIRPRQVRSPTDRLVMAAFNVLFAQGKCAGNRPVSRCVLPGV